MTTDSIIVTVRCLFCIYLYQHNASIDKIRVYRWLLIVSLQQYAASSVSVSTVEIIFASNINIDVSMIKQNSLWQCVRY